MVSKKGFMGMGIAGLVILSGGAISLIELLFLPAQLNSGRILATALFTYLIYAQLGYGYNGIIILMSALQQIRIVNMAVFIILISAIGTLTVGGILALIGWINYGKNK